MQFRAWIFTFLGIVLIATGIMYYEIRKRDIPPLPSSYSFNILTDPPEAFTAPIDDLGKVLPIWIEMERARFGGLLLSVPCFILAWRNSVGYTQKKYHDEVIELLSLMQAGQDAQQARARYGNPATAANTWKRIHDQPEQQGQVWSDRQRF